MASLRALSYLGWRALVAHPLKRLGQRGTGRERFLASYGAEGLLPTSPEDRRLGEAASRCIACGLCEPACVLAASVPAARAMGLHAAFRLYGRGPDLPFAAEALEACLACAGPACEAACPTGVPIGAVVRRLAERAREGAVEARAARVTPGS